MDHERLLAEPRLLRVVSAKCRFQVALSREVRNYIAPIGFWRTEISWSASRAINLKHLEVADFCKACNWRRACAPSLVLSASSAIASSTEISTPTNP